MLSTLNKEEKYRQVRRNFCFYLDIQDNGHFRSISNRIKEMGLRQEVFLTSHVTHVVRDRAPPPPPTERGAARWPRRESGRRADAMLERVRPVPPPPTAHQHHYTQLTVQKAIILLDKLYDTFFTPPRKSNVRIFSKHFIKIEFLDKACRPVFKEFDEWPVISVEPYIVKERKEKRDPTENQQHISVNHQNHTAADQKMTRKSRLRIKEKEEKEPKGGYCEMCNTDYADAALHRRSPHHLAFVRDHTNFLALDNLIGAGADVATFLDKATTINGERRSLRKLCNGDIESPKSRRSKRSQSPDSTVNDSQSPKRNGGLDEEKKHNTRCSKKGIDSQTSEDRQYYKVVTSTKLRSSGGVTAKRKDSPPNCNGTKPLVVKFRKVRRSELSVLSDEAEQFMFPKRASSTSSTSSDEEEEKEIVNTRETRNRISKSPPQSIPPPNLERRRLARPLALKEESSEEDSWPEDKRKRRRRGPTVAKRIRKLPPKPIPVEPPPEEKIEPTEPPPAPAPQVEVSPLREDASEKCMKWEDGKLKYTPAVEQLEFAFESVPHSEPWFETFKRQDQDKIAVKNVPQFFELYSTKSPKLPYEIGHLPPLKPNCCPLSDIIRRDDKPGPSRSYGTRGMKKQRNRNRIATLMSMEGHPRKSPREHASTLAILGSAGLLNRRKNAEDTKSTASEDTVSDSHSNMKVEPVHSETQEASERLQQFLSEVFEDAADYYVSDELMDGDPAVTTSTNLPDVLSLVSECEDCDIIRNEIKASTADRAPGRRGKFKKKNRTGWPNKKRQVKKSSRVNSTDVEKSIGRSSAEPPDDDTNLDTASEEDTTLSETDNDKTLIEDIPKSPNESLLDADSSESKCSEDKVVLRSDDKALNLDVKVVLQDKIKDDKSLLINEADKGEKHQMSISESDDCGDKGRKKKRVVPDLGDWLQPVVRVPRVDAESVRRLRSAGRSRSGRLR